MKQVLYLTLFIFYSTQVFSQNNLEINAVNQIMDKWHKDVAIADYDAYFNKMTSNSIFIGTDASEVWTKKNLKYLQNHILTKRKHGISNP